METNEQKLSRKRNTTPSEWQRNRRKVYRAKGHEYTKMRRKLFTSQIFGLLNALYK